MAALPRSRASHRGLLVCRSPSKFIRGDGVTSSSPFGPFSMHASGNGLRYDVPFQDGKECVPYQLLYPSWS